MRPVKKNNVGQTINFINSKNEKEEITVKSDYPNYSEAKKPLIGCLGSYCSYCEAPMAFGNLQVEHLSPKAHGGANKWENFLLSCNVCNSIKAHPGNIELSDYHWPHVNNTFYDYIYDCGGRILLNPQLKGLSKDRAQKLYNWLKLGRHPKDSQNIPSSADFRWRARYETWNKASRSKKKFESGSDSLSEIIEDAKKYGYWSIWFTVFKDCPDIRKALIENFEGTDPTCFDPNNGYAPKVRNPANPKDPV